MYDLKKRIFLLNQSNSKSIPSRVQVFYIPRSVSNKKHRLHVRERRLSRLHNQKQEAAKRKTGGGQKPAENSDNDLHLKPYKFHNFQALKDADYEKRLIFANWLISLPKLTEMLMFFSDEAYFYLRLPINKQNNRYWGDTDQLYTVEVPLHDEKVFSEKMWFINNRRRWPYWIKINIFSIPY